MRKKSTHQILTIIQFFCNQTVDVNDSMNCQFAIDLFLAQEEMQKVHEEVAGKAVGGRRFFFIPRCVAIQVT